MLVLDSQYKMLAINLNATKSSSTNDVANLLGRGMSRLIKVGMLCFYSTLSSAELAMGIAQTLGEMDDLSDDI